MNATLAVFAVGLLSAASMFAHHSFSDAGLAKWEGIDAQRLNSEVRFSRPAATFFSS